VQVRDVDDERGISREGQTSCMNAGPHRIQYGARQPASVRMSLSRNPEQSLEPFAPCDGDARVDLLGEGRVAPDAPGEV